MLQRLARDPSYVFSIRGLPVRLQASSSLLPLWAVAAGYLAPGDHWQNALFMFLYVLLLYACASWHELGHILLARRFGGRVTRIRVSGFGAFVLVENEHETTPRQELVIALGGPVASAILSLAAMLLAWPIFVRVGVAVILQRDAEGMIVALAATNVLLTLFNLLPVFPMDGGRALSAALAMSLHPGRAVHLVSLIGQALSVVLAIAGFAATGQPWIRLTAWLTAGFVFFISSRANRSTQPEQLRAQ